MGGDRIDKSGIFFLQNFLVAHWLEGFTKKIM